MINPTLSPKQVKAYKEATARINIWCGAVRSGKTYSSIIKFIDLLLHGPRGNTLIVGVTRDSIQRNVLTDLCLLIGAKVPPSKTTEMMYLGRKIYFVGANDERAVRRIQGSTLALAYVDEAAEIPEPFWSMLLSRLSVPGAQLLATTNPSYPNHWLKKKYLDKKNTLNLKWWQFGLDDNPALTDEYKRDIKSEYTGMWYKRYILGEWAVAHGLIYDQFDNDNIYTEEPNNPSFKLVGIDYGSANPTAACLLACTPNQWPQLRVQDTFYFNSAESGRSKTDGELADDIENWLKPHTVKTIYVDPSALSFKIELTRRGIPVKSAFNDVMPGIQNLHKWFGGKNLLIHASCKKLIEELKSYSWDPKSIARGEDKPIKVNDHLCFVKGTMVATQDGNVPIEKVSVGSLVLTRYGYKKVTAKLVSTAQEIWEFECQKGRFLATKDHPVWTDIRFIPVERLNGNFTICCASKHSGKNSTNKWKKANEIRTSKSHYMIDVTRAECSAKQISNKETKVYNLTVEDEHEYFANGILVSNCDALRYSTSYFKNGSFGVADKEYDIESVRKRAYGEQNPMGSLTGFSGYM